MDQKAVAAYSPTLADRAAGRAVRRCSDARGENIASSQKTITPLFRESPFHAPLQSFEDNAKAVDHLLDFGNAILTCATSALQEIEPRARERVAHTDVKLRQNG